MACAATSRLLPLSSTVAAQEHLEAKEQFGKVVLVPDALFAASGATAMSGGRTA